MGLVLAKVGFDLGKRRNLPRGGLLLCYIKIPHATLFLLGGVLVLVCVLRVSHLYYIAWLIFQENGS